MISVECKKTKECPLPECEHYGKHAWSQDCKVACPLINGATCKNSSAKDNNDNKSTRK